MAILNAIAGNGLIPLLEAWGIDTKGFREATIHIPYDDVVSIDVNYIPEIDIPDLMGKMKSYTLVEVEDEEDETK